MNNPELYMQRALDLARRGLGQVSPNPMVGAVVVHDNRIIGEGWHQKFGGAHAEVNAISNAVTKTIPTDSTLYVSLEPCNHHGKTPPCTDLIIRSGIRKVFIGCSDPNPLVNGSGEAKLSAANIQVVTNVLKNEAEELNKRFFTAIKKRRPYIILKWAETSDGFIARKNYESKWISGEISRQQVHQWRAEEDGVLVGSRTAMVDNPLLTVRDWTGRQPVRILLDKKLRVTEDHKIFNDQAPTIVYNQYKSEEKNNISYRKCDAENFLIQVLCDLNQRKIQSIIIEGGAKTLNDFIEQNYWDEARVFKAEKTFQDGIEAPTLPYRPLHEQSSGSDTLLTYRNFNSAELPD